MMSAASWVALVLYITCSAIDVYSIDHEDFPLEREAKPFLMPLLLLVYLFSGAGRENPQFLLIAALLLSCLGDTLLLYEKYFLPGLMSFLAGHVCYLVLFAGLIGSIHPGLALPMLIVYIFAFVLTFLKLKSGLSRPAEIVAVVAYMVMILAMSYAAYLAFLSGGVPFICWLGSLFFIMSDTTLAFRHFKGMEKRFVLDFVMVTYLLAQALIVFGFILLGS